MADIKETYSAHSKALDGNGRPVSAEIHYIVFDVESEDDALQAVYDKVEKSLNGMGLSRVEIDDRADETTFKVNVVYEKTSSTSSEEDEEEPTVSFDCGGGTRQVNRAIQQVRIFANGVSNVESDPDKTTAGLFVNWNGKTGKECEIKGVTVPTANFRETYTKIMSVSSLTTAFKRKVGDLVGCVNQKDWKGWEKGEAMFMGCSYTAPASGSDKVTVTFNFEIRTNEKNYPLPDNKTYKNKRGHDYVWAVHDEGKIEKNNLSKRINIKEMYVAQVCKYRDFSELGL